MENKRYEPMVAATYPAVMAGLCLTSLAIITSRFYLSKIIVFLLGTASLAFIVSSFSIFWFAVIIVGEESCDSQNQAKTVWWNISKWAFLFGIILIFLAIVLIFSSFCLAGFEIPTRLNSSF